MPRLSHKSAAYSTLLLTAVNLFSQLIAFFYRIALSRLIGAEGMGLFQLVFPVYSMIMALCVSGLAVAMNRLSAEALALGRTGAVRRLLRCAIGIFLGLLTPVAAFFSLGSDWIACSLLGDARTQLGLLLLIPCVLLTGLENLQKNYFYGAKNVVPPAVSEIVEQLVRTGTVLGLLILFRPAYEEDAVGLIVCGMIVCEVVSATLLRAFYRADRRRVEKTQSDNTLPPVGGTVRSILAVAAPVGFSALLGTLIGSIGAIMIPGRLAASGLSHSQALSDYGVLFGMTMQLLGLPNVFLNSLSLVMIPRLAESTSSGAEKVLRFRLRKTMETSSLFIFGALPLLGAVGAPLTRALFQAPEAGAHFTLLTLGAALGCWQLITTNLLSAIGRQTQGAAYVLLGDALQLALTYVWVANPALRLLGYAWAAVLGASLTVGLNLCTLFRRAGPVLPLKRGLLLPAFSALVSVLAARSVLGLAAFLPEIPRCLTAMSAGLLAYFTLIWVLRPLKKEEQ